MWIKSLFKKKLPLTVDNILITVKDLANLSELEYQQLKIELDYVSKKYPNTLDNYWNHSIQCFIRNSQMKHVHEQLRKILKDK